MCLEILSLRGLERMWASKGLFWEFLAAAPVQRFYLGKRTSRLSLGR